MSLPDWANLVLGSLLVVLATARLLVAIVKLLRELLMHAGGLLIDLAQLWRSDVVRFGTVAAIAAMVGIAVGTSMAKSTARTLPEITAPPFSGEHGRPSSCRGLSRTGLSQPPWREARAAIPSSHGSRRPTAGRPTDSLESILLVQGPTPADGAGLTT